MSLVGTKLPNREAGGRGETVTCGQQGENAIDRLVGLRRRAYWRGCPRAVENTTLVAFSPLLDDGGLRNLPQFVEVV